MKHLIVSVAGLGFADVLRHWEGRLGGLSFRPAESVFPAVTCTAQASFRTGLLPREHGMVSNGVFLRSLLRPSFWEQSAALVRGPRIWEAARRAGRTVGILFWQQSLGEAADVVVSPAPIHKHGGGTILGCSVRPAELGAKLEASFGAFPLFRYWGPLASSKIGDAVAGYAEAVARGADPDDLFVYLPTLDYDLQRFGPEDARAGKAFAAAASQLSRLAALAEKAGAEFTAFGDYAITQVTAPPAFPNRLLREKGFFLTRGVKGMAYPDIFFSKAFAMADHEIAHVYVRNPGDVAAVADLFRASGEYAEVAERTPSAEWGAATAGEILLVAKEGSWCAYPWWTDPREAPDFAGHVDIHNKPGYDPCELFFERGLRFPPPTARDASRIRGTHGRKCGIAWASTCVKDAESLVALARAVPL
ncbi:MAG: alkaline phosphatase family protein [Kiritimatiellae bacterium]|nr:alkaline phosphatase family protein [Kiritimatiellia bacterium]